MVKSSKTHSRNALTAGCLILTVECVKPNTECSHEHDCDKTGVPT